MNTQNSLAPKTILVVDDEPLNQRVLCGFLAGFGHKAVVASSGLEALALLDDSIDLVLLDVMMPGLDGFAVAQAIRTGTANPDVPVVMVTALSGMADRLRAVECGANDFIAKPIDKTELKVRTRSMLALKEAQDRDKRRRAELEDMVAERTRALELSIENLRSLKDAALGAQLETVRSLAVAAEYRDRFTSEHIVRMSATSVLLAERMGLSEREVDLIRHAAMLHDVGKLGVPDSVLLKPGPLDEGEWEIMKTHTLLGAEILKGATSELLQAGIEVAVSHHERFDGTGYPYGLSGEEIPLSGRIVGLADVWDACLSKRPYKAPFTVDQVVEIVRDGRGTHFDPVVYDHFERSLDAVLALYPDAAR